MCHRAWLNFLFLIVGGVLGEKFEPPEAPGRRSSGSLRVCVCVCGFGEKFEALEAPRQEFRAFNGGGGFW